MATRSSLLDPASTTGTSLPRPLARYTDYGLYALVLGTALGIFAFFTNPVPDPSFPWATLPPAFRLPITQPRIEHWPVTYTLAVWIWVFCFPATIFAAYRRYATPTPRSRTLWLAALPTTAMYAFTTYCRFFWPKPSPATWNAPSFTFVCWLYCSSYVPKWSNAAYVVATIGLVATLLAYRNTDRATAALAGFGVLALPLGLPALYAAYLRYTASQ